MDPRLKNRNMLNGDCNAFFYNPEKWQPEGGPYSAAAIRRFVRHLKEAGIDTFLINPNTQLPWYPSKKLRFVHQNYRRGDRDFARSHLTDCEKVPPEQLEQALDNQVRFHDLYLDLLEAGTDWLQVCEEACRAEGISPWLSVRMNDTHGGNCPQTSYMNNELIRQRPDLLLDKPSIDPQVHYGRYALDYGQQECRDYMMVMLEELLIDYHYDGLELDFNRDPIVLAPPAAEAAVQVMTDWIRAVRDLADRRSAASGRRIFFGLRVPFHLNLLREIGLDIRTLAREKVIDFITFCNFYQTSWDAPIDALKVELGDAVAIYGSIDGAANWLAVRADDQYDKPASGQNKRGRDMTYNGRMTLANAAGKLVLGADGLMQFNNYFAYDRYSSTPADEWALHNLTDLNALRGQPKLYTLQSSFFYPLSTMPFERPEQLPRLICPSTRLAFRLPMSQEPADRGLRLVIQLIFAKKQGVSPRFTVSVNGHWPNAEFTEADRLLFPDGDYGRLLAEHTAYNFTFPVNMIQEGWNEFWVINLLPETVAPQANDSHTIRLMSLEIGIL